MPEQQAEDDAFKTYDGNFYSKEETDNHTVLEQEVAGAIVENRNIKHLTDEYYKTYYTHQKAEEIILSCRLQHNTIRRILRI